MGNFEENRQRLLETLKGKNVRARPAKPAPKSSPKPVAETSIVPGIRIKPAMGLYCEHRVLSASLNGKLAGIVTLKSFTESSSMIDWVENQSPPFIMLDIDEPTDWRMSMDVFTNGSILVPDSKFLVHTKDPSGSISQQLMKKGALALLRKPLNIQDFKSVIGGNVPEHCQLSP